MLPKMDPKKRKEEFLKSGYYHPVVFAELDKQIAEMESEASNPKPTPRENKKGAAPSENK